MRLAFLALLHVAAPQGPGDPRALVRESARAVERGTEAAVRRSWLARVQRDSLDAAAQFGLATLDRLSYDYAGADARYARVEAMGREGAGRFPAFAALGLAQGRFTTGRYAEAGTDFDRARRLARAGRDSAAEALALIGLGWLRLRSGDPARARAVLDTAAALVGRRDLDLRAALACGRAAALVRTSGPRAAAEGRAGAAYDLAVWNAELIESVEGAELVKGAEGVARLRIRFGGSPGNEYVRQRILIHLRAAKMPRRKTAKR